MSSSQLAEKIHVESANIIEFPTKSRGRPPIKARRMAMVLLTNPETTQVAAAKMAGVNQPYTNAHKIVRSQGFIEAYSSYQNQLNNELPFDLEQAHCMYMMAYNKASNSTEMIKAIDGLCKLHGLESLAKIGVKIPNISADNSEVKAMIKAGELKLSPEYFVEKAYDLPI